MVSIIIIIYLLKMTTLYSLLIADFGNEANVLGDNVIALILKLSVTHREEEITISFFSI